MRAILLIAAAITLLMTGRAAAAEPAAPKPAASAPKPADDATSAMAHAHAHDTPVPTAAVGRPGGPHEVSVETVAYAKVGGKAVNGFLARPKDAKQGGPGIIVIHEWWGLNDNVRDQARQLASHGYTALAVDLYDGTVAENSDQAQAVMKKVMSNPEAAQDNLKQAYDYLHDKQGAGKIGVIGWCFGGGWSLQTGLLLPGKIDAVVVYYGWPEQDKEKLSKLTAPLLGNYGAEDKSITPDVVKQFQALLAELHKSADIKIFPGAGHAFANPSGKAYVKPAADEAWDRTLAFLKTNLGGV